MPPFPSSHGWRPRKKWAGPDQQKRRYNWGLVLLQCGTLCTSWICIPSRRGLTHQKNFSRLIDPVSWEKGHMKNKSGSLLVTVWLSIPAEKKTCLNSTTATTRSTFLCICNIIRNESSQSFPRSCNKK